MNILHHKSWHVRNKDNIERVRRDEAKAAAEEEEKLRKIALAEQEARTDLLRKRARDVHATDSIEHTDAKVTKSLDGDSSSQLDIHAASTSATGIYTESGNINFFKHFESGDVKQGSNKEHEEDKKAEKEKWEKDIGLLTYLGQSAVETQEKRPWYLTGRKKNKDPLDPVEKDRKLKDQMDPLHSMKSYVDKTKYKHDKKDKHRDKDSRHKHKHKKHKKDKSSERKDKHSSSSKTIEQLRAERLKREAGEKQRTLDLLTGSGSGKTKRREEPVNDRERGYNSVFNPELVRKKRDRHFYEQYS